MKLFKHKRKAEVPDTETDTNYDDFDEGSIGRRKLEGFWYKAFAVIAVVWTLFQLYTAVFGDLPAPRQRSIHLAFAFVCTFILYSGRIKGNMKSKPMWRDLTLALVGIVPMVYLFSQYMNIHFRIGNPTNVDVFMGALTILLVFEATRRSMGWVLVILAVVALLYNAFGAYIPAPFGHRGYNLARMINYQYLSTNGVFGAALGVSATYIYIFIFYAAVLRITKTGDFLIDLSYAVFGYVRGGPAKVAVMASCFFGSISGSVAANVAGTGAFTIPLMKKTGFKPHFAGAVESAASTGGQLMPPIMGSAAFIMAEMLGVGYWSIAVAAFVPAVLYYVSLLFMVDFEAGKLGLKGLPKSELPSARAVFKKGWYLLASPIILVILIGKFGYSVPYAAFWAIIVAFGVSFFSKYTKITWKGAVEACIDTVHGMIPVVGACAAAGIVLGVFGQTGLGVKMSSILIGLAHGNLFLLLLLTMFTSIILGMGLPTVACYLLLAILVAPALVTFGVMPLAAHMFIFYFGIMAAITPPVAIAAFIAAPLAGANMYKIAFKAMQLAIPGYLLPFMFIYGPELMLFGSIPQIILAICTATLGIVSMAAAVEGYIWKVVPVLSRVLMAIAALLLIFPGLLTDMLGIVLFVIAIVIMTLTNKKKLEDQIAV